MRATSTVVALSSLLIAASAAAGPNDKADKKQPASASSPTAGKSGARPAAGGSASGPATAGTPGTGSSGPASEGAPAALPASAQVDLASVRPEDMPTSVRMRRLEQSTQALKERAWQLKARVQMLKEQMIGGGAGAQTVIAHANDMGASFRLIKLIYSLDGTQVFVRTDDTAESLYKARSFDVFSGPISPGNHSVAAIATYRGHGYGVFEYLSRYTFTAKGNQAFLAGEGKISRVDCKGFEKGGPTTPLEKRAAIECKVVQVQPERPASERPGDNAPAPASTAPAPASTAPAPAPTAPTPTAPAPTTPPAAPTSSPPAPPRSPTAPAAQKPGK